MARVIADVFPASYSVGDRDSEGDNRVVFTVDPQKVMLYHIFSGQVVREILEVSDYRPPLSKGEPWTATVKDEDGVERTLKVVRSSSGCGCGSPLRRIPLAVDLARL